MTTGTDEMAQRLLLGVHRISHSYAYCNHVGGGYELASWLHSTGRSDVQSSGQPPVAATVDAGVQCDDPATPSRHMGVQCDGGPGSPAVCNTAPGSKADGGFPLSTSELTPILMLSADVRRFLQHPDSVPQDAGGADTGSPRALLCMQSSVWVAMS